MYGEDNNSNLVVPIRFSDLPAAQREQLMVILSSTPTNGDVATAAKDIKKQRCHVPSEEEEQQELLQARQKSLSKKEKRTASRAGSEASVGTPTGIIGVDEILDQYAESDKENYNGVEQEEDEAGIVTERQAALRHNAEIDAALALLSSQPTLALTSAVGKGGSGAGGVFATLGALGPNHPLCELFAPLIARRLGRTANKSGTDRQQSHKSKTGSVISRHTDPTPVEQIERSGISKFIHSSSEQLDSSVGATAAVAGRHEGTSSFLARRETGSSPGSRRNRSSERRIGPTVTAFGRGRTSSSTPGSGSKRTRGRSGSRSPSPGGGTTPSSRTVSWTTKIIEDFLAFLAKKPYVPTGSSVKDMVEEFLSDRCGLPSLVKAQRNDMVRFAKQYSKLCPLCKLFTNYLNPGGVHTNRDHAASQLHGGRAAGRYTTHGRHLQGQGGGAAEEDDDAAVAATLLPEDELAKTERLHFLAGVRNKLLQYQVSQSQKASALSTSTGVFSEQQYLVPRKYVRLDHVSSIVKKIVGKNNQVGKKFVLSWLETALDEEEMFAGVLHNPNLSDTEVEEDGGLRNYNPLILDLEGHVDLYELADAVTASYFISVQLAASQTLGRSLMMSHYQDQNNSGPSTTNNNSTALGVGTLNASGLVAGATENIKDAMEEFDHEPMSPEYTSHIANSAKKRAVDLEEKRRLEEEEIETHAMRKKKQQPTEDEQQTSIIDAIMTDPNLKRQVSEAVLSRQQSSRESLKTTARPGEKSNNLKRNGSGVSEPMSPTQKLAAALKDKSSPIVRKLQLEDVPNVLSRDVSFSASISGIGGGQQLSRQQSHIDISPTPKGTTSSTTAVSMSPITAATSPAGSMKMKSAGSALLGLNRIISGSSLKQRESNDGSFTHPGSPAASRAAQQQGKSVGFTSTTSASSSPNRQHSRHQPQSYQQQQQLPVRGGSQVSNTSQRSQSPTSYQQRRSVSGGGGGRSDSQSLLKEATENFNSVSGGQGWMMPSGAVLNPVDGPHPKPTPDEAAALLEEERNRYSVYRSRMTLGSKTVVVSSNENGEEKSQVMTGAVASKAFSPHRNQVESNSNNNHTTFARDQPETGSATVTPGDVDNSIALKSLGLRRDILSPAATTRSTHQSAAQNSTTREAIARIRQDASLVTSTLMEAHQRAALKSAPPSTEMKEVSPRRSRSGSPPLPKEPPSTATTRTNTTTTISGSLASPLMSPGASNVHEELRRQEGLDSSMADPMYLPPGDGITSSPSGTTMIELPPRSAGPSLARLNSNTPRRGGRGSGADDEEGESVPIELMDEGGVGRGTKFFTAASGGPSKISTQRWSGENSLANDEPASSRTSLRTSRGEVPERRSRSPPRSKYSTHSPAELRAVEDDLMRQLEQSLASHRPGPPPKVGLKTEDSSRSTIPVQTRGTPVGTAVGSPRSALELLAEGEARREYSF